MQAEIWPEKKCCGWKAIILTVFSGGFDSGFLISFSAGGKLL
jgi:hypothetical protein